ncbi:MAG: hypothetical protein ACTSWY_09595 [Promethearchaeota archaeon]
MEKKLEFGSPQWVKYAEKIIRSLAEKARDFTKNTNFTMCETYENAPPHLADKNGKVAWYFRIKEGEITVNEGEIDDVDFKVIGDYQTIKKIALFVVKSAEDEKQMNKVAQEAAEKDKFRIEGDTKKGPAFLVPLHNILAELTKS